ncbi:MAG TPA: hypothetical protein VLA19_06385 [Herpetosiphonaceae bacterium]|nr:hypothetical protein [Herpetosiphonaceae bacterium]
MDGDERHGRARDRGPKDLETSERMATVARASADAMKHKAQGEHETQEGTRSTVPLNEVAAIIERWPTAPKEGARKMLEQYGPPNEATPTKLFWYRKGPWKRIQITSDVLIHNFPALHSDFLTQWIDYHVPVDKFDEIGRYDGSCLVDRTAGEAGARCDSEAANTITLNLMHEIVTGMKSVEEARQVYAENMAAYTMGRSAPYAEQLLFPLPQGGTEDLDESMIAGAMARQAVGKVKDLLTGSEEGPSGE